MWQKAQASVTLGLSCTTAIKAVLGQIPICHCDPRLWSVCVIFPYLLTTDLWVFVWAGRTVLPLIGKLISRQGAGCAHPVNTVTSINWLVCFTAPIYFNIALLPVHQPALKMCDAAPWQCQKLFQLPLRRIKCCGVKAPFISQLMSCGLLHITDQTLRCRIGEVWGGNEW